MNNDFMKAMKFTSKWEGDHQTKSCCVCHITKSLNEFAFIKNKPYARCKECDRIRKRDERVRRDHSHIDRKHWLKKAYGLTPESYIELLNKQESKCAICGIHADMLPDHLCVDHNHATNQIRGLLCKQCNRGLGFFSDSHKTLEKAAEYVRSK